MISLRPVLRGDLECLFKLSVAPHQSRYVAPNVLTLAEFAYISGGYVFTVRRADEIIGLMGIVDFREHLELDEGDDPNAAFLMRMMIGSEHQRKGYGKAALNLAIGWARTRKSSAFQTGVVPGNNAALQFYEALGLRRTGRIVEDEIELEMKL
jgi:diamine N-acetyltransferase